jgi:ketosteroid isomerase-like protein
MDMRELADIGIHHERVVVRIRDGGRVRASDAEVWNRYFDVWTFREGKAVRMSAHN